MCKCTFIKSVFAHQYVWILKNIYLYNNEEVAQASALRVSLERVASGSALSVKTCQIYMWTMICCGNPNHGTSQ